MWRRATTLPPRTHRPGFLGHCCCFWHLQRQHETHMFPRASPVMVWHKYGHGRRGHSDQHTICLAFPNNSAKPENAWVASAASVVRVSPSLERIPPIPAACVENSLADFFAGPPSCAPAKTKNNKPGGDASRPCASLVIKHSLWDPRPKTFWQVPCAAPNGTRPDDPS